MKAPVFQAVDVFGNKVTLTEQKTGYTLLAFLRYSGCPWCNLAIYRLSLEYKQLKSQNCRIIAFVQSDKTGIKLNIYDRHNPRPQFPIIPDHAKRYYDLYEVDSSYKDKIKLFTKLPSWLHSVQKLGFKQSKMDGSMLLVPAWFLINNKNGRIVRSQRGISFYDHETFIDIYNSLIFKD